MIILAGTLLVSLATSPYPDTRPDTGVPADSVRFCQAYADTVQDLQVTSDVSADRRIRLSLRGGTIGTPISTPWIPADTVAGRLIGLASLLGVTPITVETLPAYRVDIMATGDNRTATFAVGVLDLGRFTRVLRTAVKAIGLLSDDDLIPAGTST